MRESYREDGKVRTRTLANLSRWPERKVEKLQRALKGLPATRDLAEAFEAFKLAVLRHKADHWRQISCEDLLASLDALKELALAPSLE